MRKHLWLAKKLFTCGMSFVVLFKGHLTKNLIEGSLQSGQDVSMEAMDGCQSTQSF